MEYRPLGRSNIEVSEIALGSWLTIAGGIERSQAEACVQRALDLGINFIDTANEYGRGAAESLLGDVLQSVDRSSYVLATKVFFPMSETDRGLSREQIHKQLDHSLERLQTDFVDLYQCHRPDPETPIEETMEALTEVSEAGKVREIGFSEWTVEQIDASLEVPNTKKFVSSQPQYNIIWRAPEASTFEKTCSGRDAPVIAEATFSSRSTQASAIWAMLRPACSATEIRRCTASSSSSER